MSKIEFHTSPELMDRIPHPYPASKAIPQWYKDLPMDSGGGPTLKRCPPFLSAMAAGYIIPMPFDLHFNFTLNGELLFKATHKLVEAHFPVQVQGTPIAKAPLLKLLNLWIVKTEPGYSTLFIPPINRFDSPLMPLTGIVETDAYYREVHLPSICKLRPGQTYVFRQGLPLVQVIPIKREGWTSGAFATDATLRQEADKPFNEMPHAYKEVLWRKIEYT